MDPKQVVIEQIRKEAALANARALMDKVSEHCFERCIPKPGSTFSSSEQSCMSMCVEKYLTAWNTVSSQYLGHVQQRASGSSFGGLGGGL